MNPTPQPMTHIQIPVLNRLGKPTGEYIVLTADDVKGLAGL